MSVDRVLRAADAVVREQQRRSRGEPRDARFDVPLSILLDLDDDLQVGDGQPVRPVPLTDDERRAFFADCTNDAACDADAHLPTCPMRR